MVTKAEKELDTSVKNILVVKYSARRDSDPWFREAHEDTEDDNNNTSKEKKCTGFAGHNISILELR